MYSHDERIMPPMAGAASGKSDGESALAHMFERYGGYLTLLARGQIGPRLRGKMDPTDIVQETFLEAHRQFSHCRATTEAELLAWLRVILAGRLAQLLRRYLGTKGRDLRLERDMVSQLRQSAQQLDRALQSAGSNPSHAVMRREQAVLLAAALARLPRHYREVMVLRYVEAMPLRDIARRLRRTEDAVQKLLSRARSYLQEQLRSAV